MKKGISLLCALALTVLFPAAQAAPLTLGEDLSDEIREPLSDGAAYIYSYRYPQADPGEEAGEMINSFYRYRAEDAAGFEIPMNADYYRGLRTAEDVRVEIGYQVTCNNDEFFSVLLHTVQGELHTWEGNTFSRRGIKAGSTVALPYLLGLLDSDESDSWLQDRQTAKADALVREMLWNYLEEAVDVDLYPDFTPEELEYGFFPEEDFYLNGEGNLVFYLQPGFAEDSGRLITFTVSPEEILDEM